MILLYLASILPLDSVRAQYGFAVGYGKRMNPARLENAIAFGQQTRDVARVV